MKEIGRQQEEEEEEACSLQGKQQREETYTVERQTLSSQQDFWEEKNLLR